MVPQDKRGGKNVNFHIMQNLFTLSRQQHNKSELHTYTYTYMYRIQVREGERKFFLIRKVKNDDGKFLYETKNFQTCNI